MSTESLVSKRARLAALRAETSRLEAELVDTARNLLEEAATKR